MYGEKAEEAEELKLDLLDVKAMYRSQVMDLATKSPDDNEQLSYD